MRSMASIGALVALSALSAASPNPILDVQVRPGPPGRKAARQHVASPSSAYERKTPTTAADFARLDAAERKRARKSAKLVRDVARQGRAA